jgi:hypothetical protein
MWAGGRNGRIVNRTALPSWGSPQETGSSCRLAPSWHSLTLSPVMCVTLKNCWYNACYDYRRSGMISCVTCLPQSVPCPIRHGLTGETPYIIMSLV